jgi:hypothetical protein
LTIELTPAQGAESLRSCSKSILLSALRSILAACAHQNHSP